jgi:surface antigen
MKFATIIGIGCVGLLLSGCVEVASTKQSIGTTANSLSGGLIGSKPAPTQPPAAAASGLFAAWASSDLGRRLDDSDRRIAAETELETLESETAGATREWVNSGTGHRGSVTPGPAYVVNQYTCRDWVDAVTIDGRQETRRSTACRQPDGSWRPIS